MSRVRSTFSEYICMKERILQPGARQVDDIRVQLHRKQLARWNAQSSPNLQVSSYVLVYL